LNEVLPFIDKSYEFVKGGTDIECYTAFREFLSKFVNQANLYNSKDIRIKRSQKFDGAKSIYPAVIIDNIPYKVEMLNTGQCGPKNGEGYRKLPYFGYQLNKIDNSWINIRCGFERFKLTEFKIVKWYSNRHRFIVRIKDPKAKVTVLSISKSALDIFLQIVEQYTKLNLLTDQKNK